MPYILSPEQKVVAYELASKPSSSTKYFDILTAWQVVHNGCIKALREGKKIMLHIPDEYTANTLTKLLSNSGLDDLTINISTDQNIPEIDIIKLRSTLKKEKDISTLIDYTLSSKKIGEQYESLSTFYRALDSTVMMDVSFRDFSANIIYNKSENRPLINPSNRFQDSLTYTSSEFYKVKKEIVDASAMYQKEFELFDHLSLFKPELWDQMNDKKIQEVKSNLEELKNESQSLASEFVKLTQSLYENSSIKVKHSFHKLNEHFTAQLEACMGYHIKESSEQAKKDGGFALFKKNKNVSTNKVYIEAFDKLSGMIQKASPKWYEELDAPTSEMITYDYIIDFIETNQKKASSFKREIIANLEQSVQRVNKINTSTAEVAQLDKKLESLIQKLNDSKLFDLTIDHNILSFIKQSELAQNIAEFVEKCHILIHSSTEYINWKKFFTPASKLFKSLFSELKRLPLSSWNDAFEFWYERKLTSHVIGGVKCTSSDFKNYFEKANHLHSVDIQSLSSELHTTRIEAITGLKKESKELYSSLFKRKQLPDVSWKNTVLMNRPFMQTVFPIHISTSLNNAPEYDLVISFSSQKESTTPNIHFFAPITSDDIQNLSENKHNFLYLNDYNYSGPLKNLSSTDKLKASKKLAKFILSLNQNIKIYQLKNANIISLCPAYDDAKLESELDQLNAKVIDTNGVLYDRLTESILFTERRPFLIIKDDLINSELYDHILWQLKLLEIFKQAGYEVLSINTTDQLENNQAVFDTIIQKIKGKDNFEQIVESLKPMEEVMNQEEA